MFWDRTKSLSDKSHIRRIRPADVNEIVDYNIQAYSAIFLNGLGALMKPWVKNTRSFLNL
jgi:hypothetical protein